MPNGFTFPFFGSTFTELTISSNGNLYFSPPPRRLNLEPGNPDDADDPPGSPRALAGYKMIAGLWEDIDLRKSKRGDAGVYVVQPCAVAAHLSLAGCAMQFRRRRMHGRRAVNFEIELRTDGTIRTRYGSGNTSIFPTVGISGGEPDAYVITSHTSEETPVNLTNADQVLFAPRAGVTQVQPQSSLTVNENAGTVNVVVTRFDDSAAATVNYCDQRHLWRQLQHVQRPGIGEL